MPKCGQRRAMHTSGWLRTGDDWMGCVSVAPLMCGLLVEDALTVSRQGALDVVTNMTATIVVSAQAVVMPTKRAAPAAAAVRAAPENKRFIAHISEGDERRSQHVHRHAGGRGARPARGDGWP